MELSPLQLEIQKWSDYELNFGIIIGVLCSIDEEGGFGRYYDRAYKISTSSKKGDPTNMYYVYHLPNSGSMISESIIHDDAWTTKVIGHPMDYGRLQYLYMRYRNIEGVKESMDLMMTQFGFENHEYIYQTVLERPIIIQEKVRDFLLSLPKNA